MASTTSKVIFWTLGIAAVGGLGYWVYKTYLGGKNKKVKLTQEELDKMLADAKASGEVSASATSKTTTVLAESFPISIGMTGEKIKALQVKLGVTPTSGYFGNKTNAAVQSKGYKVPLIESDYNKIMGINSPTSLNIKKGDSIYMKLDKAFIYSFPESKSEYLKGELKKSISLDKVIGTFDSTASNGFCKVNLSVTGYKYSGSEKVLGNFTGTFYVKEKEISKTPY